MSSIISHSDKRNDSKTSTFFHKFFRKRDDNFVTKTFDEQVVSAEFEKSLPKLTKDPSEYDISEDKADPKQEEVVISPGKRQDLNRVSIVS
jgi:hypothetical protein